MLLLAGCLAGGLATGGGAAVAVAQFAPAPLPQPAHHSAEAPRFVPAGAILVPLVFADGQLAGYCSIEVQLQVADDRADLVAASMPLLLHQVNLQTYRTPLAAGLDGQLPDLQRFRRLVAGAADRAFGVGAVRRIAITGARPA